jgi:hypothetical protein
MSPDHVNSVTLAASFLYNYLRNDSCQWTERDLNVSLFDMRDLENLEQFGGNAPSSALEVTDGFTNYFNSDAGSVKWQNYKVLQGKRI